MSTAGDDPTGLIAWFARNPVAANLLMALIVVCGLLSALTIRKEAIPAIEPRIVEVGVAYPGAAPEEVEEGILRPIEEALEDVDGVVELRAMAFEGYGEVDVETHSDADLSQVMDDVKIAVDSISIFPEEIERPIIRRELWRADVMMVQVWGAVSESTMRRLADDARDELLMIPGVASVELLGGREPEIAVEVGEADLRRYGLTLSEIAAAIRASSLDLPGGIIDTQAGDIRLRVKGQAYRAEDFERIVLRTAPDGTRITVGDVATVRDGFAETWFYAFFDGERSIGLQVFTGEDDSEIEVAARVREWVAQRQAELPDGVEIDYWGDSSYYLQDRLDMMLGNLAMGAALVFLVLGLFLRPQVAFWVIVGIPVSFLGAFALMPLPAFDISVNLMSLFAFVLVLGIVVDDAIVIGESAYAEMERSGPSRASVVRGAQRVAVPATFGVLTTVAAFLPMAMVTGAFESIAGSIGWVVILALVFSLIESKLILPAHLAHVGVRRPGDGWLARVQRSCSEGLARFVADRYTPFLARCVAMRWTTLSVFVGLLLVTGGLIAGGQLRYVFFPQVTEDFVHAELELTDGAPETLAVQVLDSLQSDLEDVNAELRAENAGRDVIRHTAVFLMGGTRGRMLVELAKSEDRDVESSEVVRRWRARVGEIAGVQKLSIFDSRHTGGGPPVAFRLYGRDVTELEAAAEELVTHLRGYDGTYEVESSLVSGNRELRLSITPEAEALGLTLGDLARQVREAFYGAEAQRIQRGTNEVKVMVRYPQAERRSVGDLERMWIRAPDGTEVPFTTVARATFDDAPARIRRIDRQRSVTISANVLEDAAEPAQIVEEVRSDFMPLLEQRFPGVDSTLTGAAEEEKETLAIIAMGAAVSLLVIYALMAIPLGSYVQPLIIMAVIPFGVIGAIFGHLAFDLPVSIISLMGCIALAGVVVNDSLIMVDFVNEAVRDGRDRATAAVEAGGRRFRAILLTSLTTFFGLVPMMLETSGAAALMRPMAVALAFGILFATVITLILIPCLYVILDDLAALFRDRRSEPLAPTETPDAL